MTEVNTAMLEALEAFHEHCHSDEDTWVATRDHYESVVSGSDEELVQDIYHGRWTPPESDPLRVAALHARKGLPWRVHLPISENYAPGDLP